MTEEQKEAARIRLADARALRGTKPKEEFVTKEVFNEKFDNLQGSVLQLVEMLKSNTTSSPKTNELVKQAEEAKAIEAASPDKVPVNPEWEAFAQETIGDYLDHCEVNYPKAGGMQFTIVIKNEKSNAPKDYLARYKTDRRTKEISTEGFDGVKNWCRMVSQNLKKSNS